ncbi:hypothetical protein CEPID_00135 [Corynebacterium epidermidicanis]|uniref:Uncharacterized protein n=1 Tax=Corynebacterium epidermidicanis TaxID=1050174 RepID=A0A0G3GQT5_9CORY|nr:hypothetical protein CEPID_00135 [Corynebacterium epidermidicanis]
MFDGEKVTHRVIHRLWIVCKKTFCGFIPTFVPRLWITFADMSC